MRTFTASLFLLIAVFSAFGQTPPAHTLPDQCPTLSDDKFFTKAEIALSREFQEECETLANTIPKQIVELTNAKDTIKKVAVDKESTAETLQKAHNAYYKKLESITLKIINLRDTFNFIILKVHTRSDEQKTLLFEEWRREAYQTVRTCVHLANRLFEEKDSLMREESDAPYFSKEENTR